MTLFDAFIMGMSAGILFSLLLVYLIRDRKRPKIEERSNSSECYCVHCANE